MTTYVFRYGTQEDIPALFNMLSDEYPKDLSEIFKKRVEPDYEDGWRCVKEVMDRGQWLLAIADDGIAGCIGLTCVKIDGCKSEWLIDRMTFVRKHHRKGGPASKLVQWAKHLATENNLPLRLAQFSAIEPELMNRWYRSQGFTPAGGLFLYFPSGGN